MAKAYSVEILALSARVSYRIEIIGVKPILLTPLIVASFELNVEQVNNKQA